MASNTPKKDYPQVPAYGTFLGPLVMGPQGGSPALATEDEKYLTTPQANPAAVRAYTRNAPYMEQFMGSPDRMLSEMRGLQQMLAENPDDPVSEYRLRILRQALGDVFGMLAPDKIESWHTSSGNLSSTPPTVENYTFTGRETTPQSRPMVQTMARRGR